MPFSKIIITYLLTLSVFLGIDMLWLGLIAKNFYQKQLGFLLANKVNWTAALIFYFIFVIGILFFATFPALKENSLMKAALLGGLFGFFTYITYDLTNLATIKDWPLLVVGVDILWGIILSSLVASAGFVIGRWIV